MASQSLSIQQFPPSRSTDTNLVMGIVQVINAVFRESEGDLIQPGHGRTNMDEIARLLAAGELHGVWQESSTSAGAEHQPISVFGVVRAHSVDSLGGPVPATAAVAAVTAAAPAAEVEAMSVPATLPSDSAAVPPPPISEKVGSFGMLAVAPSHRGTGLGRDLVRYAERLLAQRGCKVMQIALLVPADPPPSAFKEFLARWYYDRLGYKVFKTVTAKDFFAVPITEEQERLIFRKRCIFEVATKDLA